MINAKALKIPKSNSISANFATNPVGKRKSRNENQDVT
jgi:hypothetical protein